jgi:hypothetical protein
MFTVADYRPDLGIEVRALQDQVNRIGLFREATVELSRGHFAIVAARLRTVL